MKDCSNALRKAYYDVISALTYNSTALKCYDRTVEDAYDKSREFHYVIINDIATTPFYPNVVTAAVNIQIVTGYMSGGGYKKADVISSAIMDAIIKTSGEGINLAADGFNVHVTRLQGKENDFQLSSTHRIFITNVTIEHNIGQVS